MRKSLSINQIGETNYLPTCVTEADYTERNSTLRDNSNVENYSYEAAPVANAPSDTVYGNRNERPVTNLEIHEHWNNAIDKQHNRNPGGSEGVKLVYIDLLR